MVLVGLLVSASQADAQCTSTPPSSSATCVLRVNLPTIKVAQLRLNTSSTIFGPISLASLNDGQVDADGPTFTVKANRAFVVQIHSASATFSGGSGAKLSSNLEWKLASSVGDYTAISETPTTVYDSPTGAEFLDAIKYRLILSFPVDTPGTYNLPVVFTLSAP